MNRLRCFLVLSLFSVLLVTSLAYRVDYQALCEDADPIIVEIEANKPFVSQGFPMDFTVTIQNYGTVEESFNLTLYANAAVIGRTNVTLLPAETETVVFVWWANVERGDYRIRAETNPSFMMEGLVFVTLTGDVNNDYTVNILDVAPLAVLLGVAIDIPKYNATYDIDNNGIMNILDIATVAIFYGMTVEPQYCVPINLEYMDGSPVTNASVTVYYANASVARNGSVDHYGFYYPMLQEGAYYANATTSLGLQQSSDLFDVSETGNVTLQFGIVSVTVQFDNGAPIGNVDVFANDTLLGRTDSTGKVSVCGLLGPGYYEVEAYSWGTPFGSTDIEVYLNGTGVATIELKLAIICSVTLHVIHEDGTAIPNSPVVIVDAEDTVVASGDTNVNGRFYTSLLSGTYTAQVTSASNSAYKEKTFSVPGTTVTMKFNDRVRVAVRYEDTNDLVPLADVEIPSAGLSGVTGSNGESAILGYGVLEPSTSYLVTAEKPPRSGEDIFSTNSDGRLDVTVYI